MSKTGGRNCPQTGKWESKEFRASQGRKNHSAVNPAPAKGMEKTDQAERRSCLAEWTEAAAVNGKSVIVWNGLVFRAAPVFLAVVPILVAAGANTGLGLAEGAAVFLPGTPIVGGFAIFVHSQSSITDQGYLPEELCSWNCVF